MIAPRLADALSPAELPRDALADDAVLTRLEYARLDLADTTARLVDVEECRFTGASWAGSRLDKVTVSDTRFDACDLATVRLDHASMTRTELTGCRLTGLWAPNLALRHVRLRDCLLDMAALRFAALDRVELVDCQLRQADLGGADLTGATFRRCDLTDLDLSNASARGAVFVDCSWQGTRGIGSLDGAVVAHTSPLDSEAFMAGLAAAVGVRLVDPGDVPEADERPGN